ncbi:MAG: phosphosulfolactate synthase, partial [Bacteroidota bacterium]
MELHLLPHREKKPRLSGATMVMDKGLGIRQAMDLVDSAGHLIDYIKLGFGTSMVGRQIKEKVRLFRNHDIKVFVGGTLFEAFLIRDQFDDYRRTVDLTHTQHGGSSALPDSKLEQDPW